MAIDDLEFGHCIASPPPPPPAMCSGYCKVAERGYACASPKCNGCPFCRMAGRAPLLEEPSGAAAPASALAAKVPSVGAGAAGDGLGRAGRACCSFDHCNTCPASPYCSTGARCEVECGGKWCRPSG
jgi:hypothetical protein